MEFASPQDIRKALDEAGGLDIEEEGLDSTTKGDDKLWQMLLKINKYSVNTR